jgi:hypothetical protein
MNTEHTRLMVQKLRLDLPQLCWRPSPDWDNVCIRDLGHPGPCGWDTTEAGTGPLT